MLRIRRVSSHLGLLQGSLRDPLQCDFSQLGQVLTCAAMLSPHLRREAKAARFALVPYLGMLRKQQIRVMRTVTNLLYVFTFRESIITMTTVHRRFPLPLLLALVQQLRTLLLLLLLLLLLPLLLPLLLLLCSASCDLLLATMAELPLRPRLLFVLLPASTSVSIIAAFTMHFVFLQWFSRISCLWETWRPCNHVYAGAAGAGTAGEMVPANFIAVSQAAILCLIWSGHAPSLGPLSRAKGLLS